MKCWDASAWVGSWPFRPTAARTPAALERLLRPNGIDGACAAPLDAVLAADPLPVNLAFLRAVRGRRGGGFLWVPAVVVDPTLAGWEDGLHRCLALGARCVKVLPNYHLCTPGQDGSTVWVPGAAEAGRRGLETLCTLAAAAGVPVAVQLRLQDERAHHPRMKVPGVPPAEVVALALRHPGTRFLACGAYLAELPALAPAANLWAELSFVEGEDTLAQALGHLPAARLLLGTHAPLFYVRAGLAKVQAAGSVAADARTAVAAGNAEALWG